ncbi:amidohydrolase family protein [Chitinophaga agrisoli]|uniref:Amidohydrolase family protein n=1 Tax=Chitinophaga agrisoli TaxID=2607653 RepID=A0A5B2VV70_9BACT|nr:amidohydrolase family protein [Chitinophaga agrisoli]KAA2243151.1 amidohydrolase family protein [Chitinophaga agrisoli]
MNLRRSLSLFLCCCACSVYGQQPVAATATRSFVLKNITLIDGTGAAPKKKVSLVIQGDRIAKILPAATPPPANSRVLDGQGRTVIPSLVNGHGHLGLLKGNKAGAENYTQSNIIRQLGKYQAFGISQVLSLGTDRESIFPMLRASHQGQLQGATFYSAGYGFAAVGGVPGPFADKALRPTTPEEAIADVQKLADLHVDFVKMWVDDGGGTLPKLSPEIYQAIITAAHAHNLRVAAHVYYLEDARRLVAAGVDVLAHSIRDKDVDDALINDMKAKGTIYIPTLCIDDYGFVYAGQPEWLNDSLFKASLEPGVWEMLISIDYKTQQQNDPAREKKMQAFATAKRNLHKMDSAGIKIVMGTDSGAQPVRAQGFSEHLELQLMTEAGMSPLKVITAATRNGAEMLRIDSAVGTLQPGKKADFIVLDGDPVKDIRNTRKIVEIWRNGRRLPKTPL